MNINLGAPQQEPELILTFVNGKVEKETIGFTGTDCVTETAFIMEALQGKNAKTTFKSEYNNRKKTPGEKLKL